MQASQGGARGTPAEAAQTKAWPSYEAAYLQNRLGAGLYEPSGKYDAKLPDDAARAVYLDKVTENYKEEADECLKAEFKDWLEGRHEDNVAQEPYVNRPGAPARRYTYHTDIPLDSGGFERKAPGDLMETGKWKPTWWGKDSLTHLPGVRDFLRGEKKAGWENDFQMNMLAEHGPQDVEQAWQYFKHWVKGRPMTDAVCLAAQQPPISDVDVNAGRVGPINHMRTRQSWAGDQDRPESPGGLDLASTLALTAASPQAAAVVASASAASGALESETGNPNPNRADEYVAPNNQLPQRALGLGSEVVRTALDGASALMPAARGAGELVGRGVRGIYNAVVGGEDEADNPAVAIPVATGVEVVQRARSAALESDSESRASSDLQLYPEYPPDSGAGAVAPRQSGRPTRAPRRFGAGHPDARTDISQ